MQKRKSSRLQKSHQQPADTNGTAPVSKGTPAIPNGVANGTHSPDIVQKTSQSAIWVRSRLLIVALAILLVLAAGSSAFWYPWLRNAPGRPASNAGVLSSHASTLPGHPADSSGRSSVQNNLQQQQDPVSSATAESHGRQTASSDHIQPCTGQDETCSAGYPERCGLMLLLGDAAHIAQQHIGLVQTLKDYCLQCLCCLWHERSSTLLGPALGR